MTLQEEADAIIHRAVDDQASPAPLIDPEDQHRPHDEVLVLYFSGADARVTAYLVRPDDIAAVPRSVEVYAGRSMSSLWKVIEQTAYSSQHRLVPPPPAAIGKAGG